MRIREPAAVAGVHLADVTCSSVRATLLAWVVIRALWGSDELVRPAHPRPRVSSGSRAGSSPATPTRTRTGRDRFSPQRLLSCT